MFSICNRFLVVGERESGISGKNKALGKQLEGMFIYLSSFLHEDPSNWKQLVSRKREIMDIKRVIQKLFELYLGQLPQLQVNLLFGDKEFIRIIRTTVLLPINIPQGMKIFDSTYFMLTNEKRNYKHYGVIQNLRRCSSNQIYVQGKLHWNQICHY